ncbi:MAG: hypothetical protein HY820_02090 [Acidobacteria bacterium]|nr:hypothetical protein [Acidobacteriota bacterium]
MRNFYPRNGAGGLILTAIINVIWYGMWVLGAYAVALTVKETRDRTLLFAILSPGLLLACIYWQVVPVLMASAGMSLQMRRLRVYPIPHQQLFNLEVMLRVSTAVEMLLMVTGAFIGTCLNPTLHFWYATALLPFVAFNLFVSAGIRDMITRLLGWRRIREAVTILAVLTAAIPQIALRNGVPVTWKQSFQSSLAWPLPWVSASHILSGMSSWVDWLSLSVWVAIGYAFGRWQFERGLQFDRESARSAGDEGVKEDSWMEGFFRLPGRVIPDPIGAMVEKEVRSLIRAPRFRLLFIMGFSFGLLIWLPMMLGRRHSAMGSYFLVVICAYAITLLSEVLIWNMLGFDRSAAQLYWLAPMRPRALLVAKNTAAILFVFLQILIITGVCLVFRLPVTVRMFLDTVAVCMLLLILLLSVGNYSSLRFPRPVDPRENWKRSAATKFQALLLLIYPVLAVPFAFAYYARSVWEAQWPFYTVVAVVAIAAFTAYSLSLDNAEMVANDQKERILTQLGQGEGPMTT